MELLLFLVSVETQLLFPLMGFYLASFTFFSARHEIPYFMSASFTTLRMTLDGLNVGTHLSGR